MTDLEPDSGRRAPAGITRWQKVVGAGGLVAVLWVGIDSPLYDAWFNDGSAGMNHGPDGGAPEDMDNGPDDGPPEDMDNGPDDGSESGTHDPSQQDH